jgi:hypothetical protein
MIASLILAMSISTTSPVLPSPTDSLDALRPWRWSPYVAVTYGGMSGARIEAGYTIADVISLGMQCSAYDTWSRDSKLAAIGLHARFMIPVLSDATPYVMVAAGGKLKVLGPTDEYYEGMLGMMLELRPWLHMRPELGIMHMSVVKSSSGWFGGSNVERSYTTDFAARIGLEVDLRPLFRW